MIADRDVVRARVARFRRDDHLTLATLDVAEADLAVHLGDAHGLADVDVPGPLQELRRGSALFYLTSTETPPKTEITEFLVGVPTALMDLKPRL